MPDPPETVNAAIPRATYRLQLNRHFTLRDATALVPYFAELGVSHLYCSPYMRARPGSTHGYDVVDHNSINPEIGTPEDLEAFVAALREHAMGHILDWVPNHVGIMGADNAWWMDVLENGQASLYAEFFDIDWENVDPALAGRVLVPVLGDYYGSVLERGELSLKFEESGGSFAVFYHEHRFPVDPACYPLILQRSLESAEFGGLDEEDRADFSSLVAAFGHLPDRRELAPAAREERERDKEAHKRRLMRLCARAAGLQAVIEGAVRALNGTAGDPASFDALHRLLESQAYRLAYWRVASDEINYRRFFDINDLAALRMENEAVFEATHRLVLELIAAGKVDGLRLDHPDGLYAPAQYFRRLQSRVAASRHVSLIGGRKALPLYLVVEKITADFEPLREDWAVHGATGYRFVNVVNGLFIDGAARTRLDRIYRSFTEERTSWDELAREAKQLVVDTSLAAELNVLAAELTRIARARRSTRDFTQRSLRQALAEVIACFPVYRTYIAADGVAQEDRRYIDWALALARRRDTSTDPAVYDFIRSILLTEDPAGPARRFTMRFQQVTAPVTAKGVEDTALYRFNRLVSLNEVGGELDRWKQMNRSRRRDVDALPAPSPNDEYLLYQTLIGSLPLDFGARASAPDAAHDEGLQSYIERVESYMVKAAREAKVRTSWANLNEAYEDAVRQFVRSALEPRPTNLFLADLAVTVERIARFGLLNSLSQTLCKLTAPGVPDIYQGTEVWDFSLVDPDNRRPVDYEARRRLLGEIGAAPHASAAREVTSTLTDGRAKLLLIRRALELRRANPDLFAYGAYLPLRVAGAHAANLLAFMRRRNGSVAIALAPRLYSRLDGTNGWGDTRVELPRRIRLSSITNVLDGTSVTTHEVGGRHVLAAAEMFSSFPVALLTTAANA